MSLLLLLFNQRVLVWRLLSLSSVSLTPGHPVRADFSSEPALRAWSMLEAEATLAFRRSYVYNPLTPLPNISLEAESCEPGVAVSSLSEQPADPRLSMLSEHIPPQPIVMRGSLYVYRRSQTRGLLGYHRLRGLRRRHLSLLAQSFLSKGGLLLRGGSQTLLSALSRSFFFIGSGELRASVLAGSVYINFKRATCPEHRLKYGDFISLGRYWGGASSLLWAVPNLEYTRSRFAESALRGLLQLSPRAESRALAGALSPAPLSQDFEVDYLSLSFIFIPGQSNSRHWLPFNPILFRLLDLK